MRCDANLHQVYAHTHTFPLWWIDIFWSLGYMRWISYDFLIYIHEMTTSCYLYNSRIFRVCPCLVKINFGQNLTRLKQQQQRRWYRVMYLKSDMDKMGKRKEIDWFFFFVRFQGIKHVTTNKLLPLKSFHLNTSQNIHPPFCLNMTKAWVSETNEK